MNYTSNIPSTTVAPNMIPNYKAYALEHYLRQNSITNFPNPDIMKADSGASSTYIRPAHQHHLKNIQQLRHGPTAILPDNTKIRASSRGSLILHDSLKTSALIYPGLTNESLLSIGQLCDQGCIAIFDKQKLSIIRHGKQILTGNRNLKDGLWDVPFKEQKINQVNYIIAKDKSKSDLAKYLHGCAFSPVISTFQKCINKGNFITWPGIDDINFKTMLKTTEATLKGHMDQERKNSQSTKPKSTPFEDNELLAENDSFPEQITQKTKSCFYTIYDLAK